jgi:hypothetical protein
MHVYVCVCVTGLVLCKVTMGEKGDSELVYLLVKKCIYACMPARTHARTSFLPAISLSKMALRVAVTVGTLPKMVVRPMTSTSGELKAAMMAMLSSARGVGSRGTRHLPGFKSRSQGGCARGLTNGISPIPGSVSMMSLIPMVTE